MLDLKKRYFVAADCHSKSAIRSWAEMHTMKIKGKEVILPTRGRAYELDVQRNSGLTTRSGIGIMDFLDDVMVIGRIYYDVIVEETCIVIQPDLANLKGVYAYVWGKV